MVGWHEGDPSNAGTAAAPEAVRLPIGPTSEGVAGLKPSPPVREKPSRTET